MFFQVWLACHGLVGVVEGRPLKSEDEQKLMVNRMFQVHVTNHGKQWKNEWFGPT